MDSNPNPGVLLQLQASCGAPYGPQHGRPQRGTEDSALLAAPTQLQSSGAQGQDRGQSFSSSFFPGRHGDRGGGTRVGFVVFNPPFSSTLTTPKEPDMTLRSIS